MKFGLLKCNVDLQAAELNTVFGIGKILLLRSLWSRPLVNVIKVNNDKSMNKYKLKKTKQLSFLFK